MFFLSIAATLNLPIHNNFNKGASSLQKNGWDDDIQGSVDYLA